MERRKDIERRRTWAGGGNMPPAVRSRYTEAERAALSVIADQCKRKGFCALCLDEIARLAGVSRTSVQNAIRKARTRDVDGKWPVHISVTQRPQPRGKSLTNIIKVVCATWLGWIARATGFKRLNTSETSVKNSLSKPKEKLKWALGPERDATLSSSPKASNWWVRGKAQPMAGELSVSDISLGDRLLSEEAEVR